MSNGVTFQPLGNPLVTKQGPERRADIDPRLTRTHYFDGRLLTAEDLTRDQLYLDQRLREVGQVMGSGVMTGLETRFDDIEGVIRVQPGIGVTPAGRVLELFSELSVDLGKRALIAGLNDGLFRRFNRGLYAVVLRYAEVRSDIAEVFPQDLGEKRTFQHNVFAEGVQLGLVPLPQALPQAHELSIRANLVRQYLGDGQASGTIPEDAVALGVLAIIGDRAAWFDGELLRHPLRSELMPGDIQADLARHYQVLFDDVISYRNAGSRDRDFAASEYFHLLPPAGPLPKDAIDPMGGRQGFFPESYQVWAAPIRLADLELVRKESMRLPPLDLSLNEPVDVIVLAPLRNQDYGYFARQLEREFDPEKRRLPFLDLLRLRLYPRRRTHELDTDETTWEAIWDRVGEHELVYIRRPTRAAETAISGIVLAQGVDPELPEPTEPAEPSPADGGGLVIDEDEVFLKRMNLGRLGTIRAPTDVTGNDALATLQAEEGDDPAVILSCLNILLLIERQYDALVWQTLLAIARNGTLVEFREALQDAQQLGTVTGEAVATIGATMTVDTALLSRWQSVAAGGS